MASPRSRLKDVVFRKRQAEEIFDAPPRAARENTRSQCPHFNLEALSRPPHWPGGEPNAIQIRLLPLTKGASEHVNLATLQFLADGTGSTTIDDASIGQRPCTQQTFVLF
jgi:hypothetical protein